mgnify:FL=1
MESPGGPGAGVRQDELRLDNRPSKIEAIKACLAVYREVGIVQFEPRRVSRDDLWRHQAADGAGFGARARRRFERGLKSMPAALIKKVCKAKTEAVIGEKPAVVRTHLRDMM